MTKATETLKHPRIAMLSLIPQLSIEQLNHIPTGFNNNIIWNLGHMVAAQQGICYKRAGLNTIIDDDFFNTYKPGTKPERFIDAGEAEQISSLLLSTLDQLATDLGNNIFVRMLKLLNYFQTY